MFVDGSMDAQSKTGYGAFLIVSEPVLSPEMLKKNVKIKRFVNTTSSRLELQTLLWALNDITTAESEVFIYTDSQTIIGLMQRRAGLETKNYYSAKNKRISNHDLYREFFSITDILNIKLFKVQGHQPTRHKDEIHRLFTLVDRASRNAMRRDKSY
jgi:ribonuclease HI